MGGRPRPVPWTRRTVTCICKSRSGPLTRKQQRRHPATEHDHFRRANRGKPGDGETRGQTGRSRSFLVLGETWGRETWGNLERACQTCSSSGQSNACSRFLLRNWETRGQGKPGETRGQTGRSRSFLVLGETWGRETWGNLWETWGQTERSPNFW